MEHTKHSSGVSKAALATAVGAGVLGLSNSGGGGLLGGLFGGPRYSPPVAFAAEQAVFQGGYVTEKEMCLTREIAGKDSAIARLEAEKYADAVVTAATTPLANRICALETATAVNAARDQDFRRYVNTEFVHQPKASIRESIVVCKQCGCNNGSCGCCC